MGRTARAYLTDFLWFGVKQAWACLFGGLLLALIIGSKLFWPPDAAIARYDFLFFAALLLQLALLLTKLETWDECKIIFCFHIVGTVMEIFKTDMGSWAYPEDNLIRIGGVPLFSGFMYSAVGSYIARVWRIFDFRYTHFPDLKHVALLGLLIYINFFTHHYVWDIRYLLFAGAALIYGRTWIHYKPHQHYYRMPLLLACFLTAFFVWIAENLATVSSIWIYPSQKEAWHIVPLSKMGSWFLLLIISFVMVSLLHKQEKPSASASAASQT